MARYTVTRFHRVNTTLLTDEYRTDEVTPRTLAYLDHYGDGMADVTVFDPYTGHMRVYAARTTSKALGIVTRHVERLGYKNCLEFHNLTTGTDCG